MRKSFYFGFLLKTQDILDHVIEEVQTQLHFLHLPSIYAICKTKADLNMAALGHRKIWGTSREIHLYEVQDEDCGKYIFIINELFEKLPFAW